MPDDDNPDWYADSDEDHADAPDPLREALEQPLRQQAATIAHLARALVSSLPEAVEPTTSEEADETDEAELAENVKAYVLESAFLLGAKLANAYASTDFGQRMEMALLIKRAACELQTQVAFLGSLSGGRLPPEYVTALRAEIDVFRQLFVPWVASFDPTDHIDDGWGLFRPLLPPQP